MSIIDVIIPALNEESSIAKVINDIPHEMIRNIIVADNGSTDDTALKAIESGAIVVKENRKGYGRACLAALQYIADEHPSKHPDIIVFLDGDYSDYPEDLAEIVTPIIDQGFDMVIGSRNNMMREKNALTIQQVFGNWLATELIYRIYGFQYSDLGPFRAIKYNKLLSLDMKDKNYGWTVEMQIKALRNKLKITEIPIRYRERIGQSKVSGTVKGTFMAGYKIITTIFKYALSK